MDNPKQQFNTKSKCWMSIFISASWDKKYQLL